MDPTETDLKNVRTLNRDLVRMLQNDGQALPDDALGFVAAEVPGNAGEGVAAAARAFGQRIQWVLFNPMLPVRERKLFNFFAGANHKGVTYLVADKTDRPHLAVLGHEVFHQLRRDNPDLYDEFVVLGRPFIKLTAYRLCCDTAPLPRPRARTRAIEFGPVEA